MIKKVNFPFVLFIACLLIQSAAFGNTTSSSKLLCVVDVVDKKADVKESKVRSYKNIKSRQQKKIKKKRKRNLRKILAGILGLGLFGFLFRKKRKRKKRKRIPSGGGGGGWGGIFLTVLLLGGLIWFLAASFPLRTLLLIIGIALLAIGLIALLIYLAFRNY